MNSIYETMKKCYEQRQASLKFIQDERDESPQKYWVHMAKDEFNMQVHIACDKGVNPDHFVARINNIYGKENIKAIAKYFIEQKNVKILLSSAVESRIITRDLEEWFPDFTQLDEEINDDTSYSIQITLKK